MTKRSVDRYDIEARYVPALICSVPFFFFSYYFLNDLDGAFWESALMLTVGSIGLPTALYFVAIHFCTALGKIIENNWFRNGLTLPTTEFLLDKDTNLSLERKDALKRKIKLRFNIKLQSVIDDTDQNRRLIHESIGQVRSGFYRKNHLVQQRNIRYGMTRNLLSGSLVAVILSGAGYVLSNVAGNAASQVALALLIIYCILAGLSAALLNSTARQYAHTLFDEFLAK